MKKGKLPEHTFIRSVLKPIQYKNAGIKMRAGIGNDGACFQNIVTAMGTNAAYGNSDEMYALYNALNNVMAAGGKPFGIMAGILMPAHTLEADIKKITWNLNKLAAQMELEVMGGDIEITADVLKPIVTVTAYGDLCIPINPKAVVSGMDIVMVGWAGMYGGGFLAKEKEEELLVRYPKSYIKKTTELLAYRSLKPVFDTLWESDCSTDAKEAKHENIVVMHDISTGGVFGALWQILKAADTGGRIWLSKIPIKQETVEISEFFGINPYMLNGQGGLLIITRNGEEMEKQFLAAGIMASVLGKITDDNDRVVMVGDEVRFLTPLGRERSQIL